MIFGSLLNGLFDNTTSDIDMTIIIDDKSNHKEILMLVHSALREAEQSNLKYHIVSGPYWMTTGAIFSFKVELKMGLKLYYFECDILVNKYLEIRNSQLIGTYCKLDRRYRENALVLKRWSKQTNSDKNKRLNSFSMYMLLLGFMIHKNYLPNLQ